MFKSNQIKINANAVLETSTKHNFFTLIGIGIVILCCGIVAFVIKNPNLFVEICKIIFPTK